MEGGVNLHSHAHQSPGHRNDELGSSSTRAEPTDDEMSETQTYTDPNSNPHDNKKEYPSAQFGHLTPAQRRRAVTGDEKGGLSSQPEASTKQIPRASSPTSITPDELHQNDGDEGNAPVHPTPTATHEPLSGSEAGRRALGSHGPVYQTYHEYGTIDPKMRPRSLGFP